MAQNLNQVPPDAEVWDVAGTHFLVWYNTNVDPPIPMVWKVESSDRRQSLGFTKSDRTFDSWDDFHKTGALRFGGSIELANTTENPLDVIYSDYATEVKVKPWLAEPEILTLWMQAALEGRSLTDAELQGTDWWRTHTDAERQWLSLNASDPATADQLIKDNRLRVANLFSESGVANASQDLVNQLALKMTTGEWSEAYAISQIKLLSDPQAEGTLDATLKDFRSGLDTTREGEDQVRSMINTWLGPAYAGNYSDEWVDRWAGELRNDPDARMELEDMLRSQRLALFPEYKDKNLTYEDIAAPWRGVFQQVWGETADETDPLFSRIVRMNDLEAAQEVLRDEGLERSKTQVVDSLVSGLGVFGGQVRRADPAIQ